MLTPERPEGPNVNPVRLIQPEQNPAYFYSTPWITPETAHDDFGQIFEDRCGTVDYRTFVIGMPCYRWNHGCTRIQFLGVHADIVQFIRRVAD
jgi:hypothetical protein